MTGVARHARTSLLAVAAAGALLLTPSTTLAQASTITPPVARVVRRAHDSTTVRYTVAGIPVIHRTATANDIVAANVYLLGGARQVTDSTAGIEPLLLELSERGTRRYTKLALRRKMARLGSAIVVSPGADWTIFGLRSTVDGFDSTWAILAERLVSPRFDAKEFASLREQVLSAVRQRGDAPDGLVHHLADSASFAGHAYETDVGGTERSISRLTLAELQRYQREHVVRSRMLIVIVGNVSRARVERLVAASLGRLPEGSYRWTLPDTLPRLPGALVTASRSLPTNYILGLYAGPPATSRDYQALRVATAVLSGNLFAEIRSRRNLTYAVEAPFVERGIASGGLYVTTVSPDTVLELMSDEVRALQRELVPEAGLERLVQQFITEYFLDNETNAAQADFLARAELFRGDHRAANRFVDELREVTPDDVRRVARRYMRGIRFAYVGDAAKISRRSVERFR